MQTEKETQLYPSTGTQTPIKSEIPNTATADPAALNPFGGAADIRLDSKKEPMAYQKINIPTSQLTVQVKNVDMPEEMQEKAIELARQALQNSSSTTEQQSFSTRDVAGAIKREFDRLYGTSWHCIVGKVFGSFVTHEAHCFIFYYVGPWAIMLFKTV